ITFAPTPPPPSAIPLHAPTMNSAVRALHELRDNHPPVPPKPANSHPPVLPKATSGHPAVSAKPAVLMAPAAPVASPPGNTIDSNPLFVPLTSLAEGWPEAVRHELVQLSLVDAKVALPTEVVERALKQGRVAFTWKTLRSWIKPAPLPVVSAHDSSVLELPLKVVAPPFLARQKEATKSQKKVFVDDEIPNLFFGFPRPEAGSATVASAAGTAAANPADTNFYVWDDGSDKVHPQEDGAKRIPSPGTKFVAKYATPNEIVSRAASLDGVAGALIALPDGLMVASRLRADLNGETLA